MTSDPTIQDQLREHAELIDDANEQYGHVSGSPWSIELYKAADRIDALEALLRDGIEAVIDLDGCPGQCATEGQCFTFRARKALEASS